MSLLFTVAYLVLLFFVVLLLVRLVFTWIQQFAREWKPSGVALVVAELTYTVTDPPLKALRKVLPPLRIGSVALDLGFILLFIACSITMAIVYPYAL